MDALRDICDEIIAALGPLIAAAEDPQELKNLLADLGWTPAAAPQPLQELAQAGTKLVSIVAQADAAAALEAFEAVKRLVDALNELKNKADAAFPGGIDVANFKTTINRDLVNYLIAEHLLSNRHRVGGPLKLAGLVRLVDTPAAGLRKQYVRREILWNRIGELLTDPLKGFREAYGWTSPNPKLDQALADVASLLESYDLLFEYFEPDAALLAFLNAGATSPIVDALGIDLAFDTTLDAPAGVSAGVQLVLRPATASRGPALTFLPYAKLNGVNEIPLTESLSLFIRGNADFTKGIGITIAPGKPLEVQAGFLGGAAFVPAEALIGLKLKPLPGQTERRLLGGEKGSRLSFQSVAVYAGARTLSSGKLDAFASIEVEKARAVIEPGADADSFLSSLLGGVGISAELSFGLQFSYESGFHFTGSGALEIAIPLHVRLGPIDFQALTLALRPDGSKVLIDAGATVAGKLGPLNAVVEGVGFTLVSDFPDPPNGNLGPIAASFRFKPPNGVGLSLDAGIIKGGGYLFIDAERGEYAGALELTFSEVISLKAIGLISTKMPDGSKGFSLLIIITADFGTGIQLSFGFTLLAVGGLIGLNRTMKLQPLMEGVRTGAIESIMFPQNVIANAPKIISDLRTIFPPQQGTFLIGPMAKLGWGTPTLMSISLGIIIEIPGNIAIVGILKIAIPADELALIILQVNFAGAIEFDKKRFYFFAALFESRIVFLTIEGEMGVLMAFGDDANLVVSVGGFHPRFNPPPLPFPSPRRISISLLNTPLSRVRIEGYFAITSNTAQFGARVEVFFGLDELNVQGHFAFDALFQFSPFYFVIELSASFSVKVFGVGLFSVSVRGSLDGPTPYHIKGHGSISLLFFDIDVDFKDTWGESRNTELPPIQVMPILDGEIKKAESWRAILPASNRLLVSIRKMPAAEAALILHPLGVLSVSQRALPLEIKLDKVGPKKPSDVNKLSVAVVGGGLEKKDDAFDQFAPAQFQDFSDADKLSRPAFAPERSGVKLSVAGAEMRSSLMVKRHVRYEEIIIDNNYKRFVRRFSKYIGTLFEFFLNGNSAARCAISATTKKQFHPFDEKMDLKPETYSVTFQSNNKAYANDSVSFHSEASAREYMSTKISEDPALAETLHVIPAFERAA